MDIITRDEAVNSGALYFFTGKPCKRGHIAQRYIRNGGCVDCMRPKNTAIVISPKGEILPASNLRLEIQQERQELERRRLALKERQAAAKAQEILLRQERLRQRIGIEQTKFHQQQQDRLAREQRRQRTELVKSRLVDVILFVIPADFEIVTAIVWAYAVQRDPRLRLEDIVTGRELPDWRHVLLCFPEDKEGIIRVMNDRFFRQQAPPDVAGKLESVQALLTAEVEQENEWPEGDPK